MTDNHLDASKKYWNDRAEGFSESVGRQLSDPEFVTKVQKLIETQTEGRRNLKVLDVGCGPGFFPLILGGYGHDITAVDYSEGMLHQAMANCDEHGVKAAFVRMDAQHLEFPDETFDVVISRNLVWNLDSPADAYREWLRVLKKGGKLMLFDGNHYLYLHDSDYATDHPDYVKEHAALHSVDVSVMERIAMELPLSSERRPQWDIDTLEEMGVRDIFVRNDTERSIVLEKDGKKVFLPFTFFICATKL